MNFGKYYSSPTVFSSLGALPTFSFFKEALSDGSTDTNAQGSQSFFRLDELQDTNLNPAENTAQAWMRIAQDLDALSNLSIFRQDTPSSAPASGPSPAGSIPPVEEPAPWEALQITPKPLQIVKTSPSRFTALQNRTRFVDPSGDYIARGGDTRSQTQRTRDAQEAQGAKITGNEYLALTGRIDARPRNRPKNAY